MRMFQSRNEWHLKLSVFAANSAMLIMTFFNLAVGIMGREMVPEQANFSFGKQEAIYLFLISQINII